MDAHDRYRSPRGAGNAPRPRLGPRLRAVATAGTLALVGIAVAGCTPPGLDMVVDTETDGVDVAPGNGTCATAGGRCSLRAALMEANAVPGLDRITIASGVDPTLSLGTASEDANAGGDLDVTDQVAIVGQGATVDAAGLDRVFDVISGHLDVRDLTITGGAPPQFERGGGIQSTGVVTLFRVTVTGNQGGGISSLGQHLWISESTVSDNDAASLPGGVVVGSGTATFLRSLLLDDVTSIYGYGSASLTVLDSTVRSPGDAVSLGVGSGTSKVTIARSTLQTTGQTWGNFALDVYPADRATVAGSILDAPSADPAHEVCYSPVTSAGSNVVSDASCGFTATGDVQGVSPLLGPLADNGGPTASMLPHAGSPAIDRIPAANSLCTIQILDQRRVPRPVGPACDAGAVEGAGPPVTALSLTVDTSADGIDVSPGDGICATADGACSLRAAVMEANASNPELPSLADTITIAAGIDPVLALAGAGEDGSLTGDLDVLGSLAIHGGGSTVDAAGLDRAFDATAPELVVTDLTITGGQATSGGGGVRSTGGHLDLTDVALIDNHADGPGGGLASDRVTAVRLVAQGNSAGTDGGGIATVFADLDTTTLADNGSGGYGGGALIYQSGTIHASTISGNTAIVGGALSTGFSGGTVSIDASTLTGNDAPTAAAAWAPGQFGPGLILRATTVAENTGSTSLMATGEVCTRTCFQWDATVATGSIITPGTGQAACDAPLSGASSLNLAPDGTCGATLPGSGLLGPLGDNGGPTPTRVPLAGSGAVDAVPPGTAGACDGTIPFDQRGVARPTGPACDVGAVEQ